jgi:hypothetical protein
MRFVALLIAIVAAGCSGSLETDALTGDDNAGDGAGGGAGAPAECHVAADCVAEGPKCCDCPTHAVPTTDPTARACSEVMCPPRNDCGSPLQATCNAGHCDLACAPVACDMTCADGFVTDGNGCLTCACAAPPQGECSVDPDCARVKDDCCGCTLGGKDTAIPVGAVAAHEAALNCSANPTCPGGDVCAPDLAARCVQGECALVSGALPANACGRADLAACPMGEHCTVNANDQATMYGVGVCQP